MADQPPADDPAGSPPNSAGTGRTGELLTRLSRAAGAAVGLLALAASRFGNWLVSIGWGKFILLSALLLALAGMTESMFGLSHRSHRPEIRIPVDLKISVDSDGLHIAGPSQAQGQAAPAPPNVQIDDKGVRIRAEQGGHDVSVVIDQRGVRVEETPPAAAGSSAKSGAAGQPDAEGKSARVTVPPGMISDPDKVSEAVEAAKDQIEEIVQEQVDRKVAHLPQAALHPSAPWPNLAELAVILLFLAMIVKIALGSKRRAESRAQVADAVAAEEGLKRQLAEARLKTMQAQVEPHFLFNTLASVDYLIGTDPTRASRMQKNLIQYLRAALPQMRQASSTLGQELALCRSYLEILKVRMDDRLQFAIAMPAGLSTAAFPPMMLQTLVENSIKHGLEPKPEGGALTLTADVVNGNLRVAVSDTGLGFGVAGAAGSGVGLNNVRERLQALFGARARLSIEPNSPTGTIVTIEVPYTIGVAEAMPQASPQPA
jgi:Histidine kinase